MVIALWLPAAIAGQTTVGEATASFTYTKNMQPMGYSARVVPPSGPGSGIFNSDLAFWGSMAIQGTYEGFRLIDISQPDNPVQIIDYTGCVGGSTAGNQGDVIVWGNVLVRSWNSPTPAGGRLCGEVFTPAGQEGVHVFDISNPLAPVALTFVATPCGSHTATGVPDAANNRLLVYNSPSSGTVGCRGIDILEVPLDDPASASYLRFEPSGDPAPLPFEVVVAAPSPAAGTYQATGAEFGPAADATGISGTVVLAQDGSGTALGCNPFVSFPAGAIALVDRGTCGFAVKAANAQDAGAVAMIVANNAPGAPITMGGTDASITIPSVMVSQADGAMIKAGLPATGTVRAAEQPDSPDRSCHDTGVILGSVNLAACAGGNGLTVWSMNAADGGSLEDPAILYSKTISGVTIGHSASFTWDGDVLVFGHEPGGGGQAQCQATSPLVNRTLFFFEARTGDALGTFVHPRPQTATENCTWHNYNVVPTDKRYVLVSGNYQSGVSVIDFTSPASAFELAYADPAPLSETTLAVGGDWSTYWYDGRIYESDITRGLIVWNLNDKAVAGAQKLGHLNPQTQEMSFAFKGVGKKDKIAGAAAFAAATANAPANPVIPPGTQRFDLGD
ncbi:MAG TPA: PA domain-containing protein [Candidatus Limnocylindria bacterium]|nr:PA domain-containing protein [Candidatus Limnocylindria bacterium]